MPVTSHRGEYLAKALENSLMEWGLKNIFTVTLDNAASNDSAMSFFKKKLMSWGLSSIKIKYVHMRCAAHILNLVVNEGLKEMSTSIKKVREVVRYIRSSPSRLMKFKEFSDFLGIQSKVALCLDVPTRWNSTYLMLKSACIYEKTFVQYEETELSLRTDLGDNVPDFLDWQYAKNMVKFLHHFYEMIIKILGS